MIWRHGITRALMLLGIVSIAAVMFNGCSSGAGTGPTTSPPSVTSSPSIATTESTSAASSDTTTPPVTLNSYDKELAQTAKVENSLARYLGAQNLADTDPRMAIIYGLRARVQALSCRKALDSGDMSTADSAMRDVYSTLNLGKSIATGTVAQTLADAYATVKDLGIPSDSPDKAKQLLDACNEQLKTLITEAQSLMGNSTSTTG